MALYLFGAGNLGKQFITNNPTINPKAVIDNDTEKVGGYCNDIKCISFNEFETCVNKAKDEVIITSLFADEMTKQLGDAGLKELIKGYYNGEKIVQFNDLWGKTVYSQFGEELAIKDYLLKHYDADYKGVYVDVGCHHPFSHNNTVWLKNMGWKGVNIDANPWSIELFNIHRPEDININCGVSDEETTLKYYDFYVSVLNTFDENMKDRSSVKAVYDVPVHRLNNILEEHNIQHVDFIDIDAEGFDYRIAKDFDWDKYKPGMVIIEYGFALEDLVKSDLNKLMKSKGYVLNSYITYTAFFVRSD